MELRTTLEYKHFYKGPTPKYEDLVKDIPSDIIIKLMCFVNQELSFGKDRMEDIQNSIIGKVFFNMKLYNFSKYSCMDNKMKYDFFTHKTTLEVIQKELKCYRNPEYDSKSIELLEQEENLFKAYLVIASEINAKMEGIVRDKESVSKEDFFRRHMWAVLVNQIDLQEGKNIVYEIFRCYMLLKFLSESEKTEKAVCTFLTNMNMRSIFEYIVSMLNILQTITVVSSKNAPFIQDNGYYKDFLDHLCLESDDFEGDKKDFIALREKPLFKFNTNSYTLIYWNFLVDKLYTGLLFDFYEKSEIKKHRDKIKVKNFGDFKSFIGNEFSEKFLIAPILDNCLGQNRYAVKFADDKGKNKKGYPDFYYREGKYLFLFEIKDNFMPAKVIDSYDYEQLIADIETKFVESEAKGKPQLKGINQIFNQLTYLNENCYTEDNFVEKRIKKRNLVVYPIIIYTDRRYQLPTLDQYLNEKLEAKTQEHSLKFKVQPLTLINAEWLCNHYPYLKANSGSFKKMLDDYQKYIKKRKQLEKFHRHEYFHQQMSITFEKYTLRNLKDSFNQRGTLDIIKDLGLAEQ